MKNKKGFTLVELLVVIAIIGILSSVAVVNLNSARDKAKTAAAQGALSNLTPAIILCHDDGNNVTNDGATACSGTAIPVNGDAICAGSSAQWPTLPAGWGYNNTCDSSASGGTYTYGANSAIDTVTCTEQGCVTT